MIRVVIPELRVSAISGTQGCTSDRRLWPWVPALGRMSEAGMTSEVV
jgi:hypothetical protein